MLLEKLISFTVFDRHAFIELTQVRHIALNKLKQTTLIIIYAIFYAPLFFVEIVEHWSPY